MSVFALRLPEDLKDKAASQAAEAGISLNQFIATAVGSTNRTNSSPSDGIMISLSVYPVARIFPSVMGRGSALATTLP